MQSWAIKSLLNKRVYFQVNFTFFTPSASGICHFGQRVRHGFENSLLLRRTHSFTSKYNFVLVGPRLSCTRWSLAGGCKLPGDVAEFEGLDLGLMANGYARSTFLTWCLIRPNIVKTRNNKTTYLINRILTLTLSCHFYSVWILN